MNEDEYAELSAGYALGALDAGDRRAFEDARAAHPEWEQHVEDDLAAAALLGEVGEIAPAPRIREELLRRIAAPDAGDGQDVRREHSAADGAAEASDASSPAEPAGAPATGRRRPRRRTWFALAAAIVLVAAAAIASTVLPTLLRPPAVVALEAIESAPDAQKASADVAGGSTATLHWSVSQGKAVLVADALPEIAADRTFELWYVRDGGPVAAGTFIAGTGATTALLDAGMRPGDVIAVTVEQHGGSPTGAPTTDPILAITTG